MQAVATFQLRRFFGRYPGSNGQPQYTSVDLAQCGLTERKLNQKSRGYSKIEVEPS